MGNKWQEEYREWMDRAYFTRAEKESLVKGLMEQKEGTVGEMQGHGIGGSSRFLKGAGIRGAMAACLAGCLLVTGVAGASAAGLLKSVPDTFAGIFQLHGGNEDLAREMGTALGKTAVSNGIRVTADAMIVDRYASAVVFSVEREDGKPLGTGKKLISDSWGFEGIEVKGPEKGNGASWGSFESYDENPADAAIQYMMINTYDNKMAGDKMSVCLTDLYNFAADGADKNFTIKGEWKLEIPVKEASDTSITLGTNQKVSVGGHTVSVDSIEISPLSYHMTCSAKKEGGSAKANARIDELDNWLTGNPVTLEMQDGKKICLDEVGCSVSDSGDRLKYTLATTFDTLIPLEDMKSVHIGEAQIPVREK